MIVDFNDLPPSTRGMPANHVEASPQDAARYRAFGVPVVVACEGALSCLCVPAWAPIVCKRALNDVDNVGLPLDYVLRDAKRWAIGRFTANGTEGAAFATLSRMKNGEAVAWDYVKRLRRAEST